MKLRTNPFICLLSAVACLAAVNTAHATNYWFDNNGTDPGFGVSNAATYDWMTAAPSWSTNGTGTGAGLIVWPISGSSNDAYFIGSGPGESYTVRLGSAGDTGISLRSFGLNLNSTATGANGFGNVTIGQTGDTGAMSLTGNMSLGALNGSTLTVHNPIAALSRSLTFRGGNVILNGAVSANNATGGAVTLQAGLWGLDSGTLTLAGANVGNAGSSSYGGTTLYTGYTLNLDYTTQNNNKVSDSRALTFGSITATDGGAGGTLNLIGGTHTEVVLSTALNAGAAQVNRLSGSSLLRMNAITRNSGGTIDFTDFVGGVGSIAQTDTANVSGILGGYATVAGTDWAINSAAADGPIAAYSGYTDDTWSAGNNVTVTASSAPTTGSTANSLRFHAAAANTITLDGSNFLTSGGILVTSEVGNNLSTITGGTLAGAAAKDLIIIQNNTANGLTINSTIADNSATALTKSGAGLLTLGSANTYTGQTYINAGTLSISSNANLGPEATGAQLNLNGGTVRAAATFGLHNGTPGTNNRNILLMGRGTIDVTGSNNLTVAGMISGNYLLTKIGTGSLTLSGTNPYTGGTLLTGGVLNINGSGATGTGTLTFNASHTTTSIANTSGLPVTIATSLNASVTTDANISFSGAGDLTTTGAAIVHSANPSVFVTGAGKLTVGSINANTPLTLAKQGPGPLAITGAAGANIAGVDLGNGTLIIGNKASLGAGTLTFSTTDGVTLQASATLTGSNKILNEVALNADAVISGTSNLELGGVIGGAAANSLTKEGAGTLIISGSNTYSGETIVNGGTLLVNGFNDPTSAASVTAGTLGGVGTVAGPVGIASGATVAPGTASTVGTFVTGTTTFVSGSVFDADIITDSTSSDLLFVDGNLNLAGATLATENLGTTTPGSFAVFTIASYTGTLSGTFNGLPEGATVPIDGKNYTIRYADGFGNNNITLTAPEVIGTPYDAWALTNITNIDSGADATPAGDPDKDGTSNLAEFAFNGNPLAGSDNGRIYLLTADSDFDSPDTAQELILTVAVRSGAPAFSGSPSPGATVDSITYTIEGSTTLGSFDTTVNVVPTPVVTGLPAPGSGYEYRSFSLAGSNGLPSKGFLRAKVTN